MDGKQGLLSLRASSKGPADTSAHTCWAATGALNQEGARPKCISKKQGKRVREGFQRAEEMSEQGPVMCVQV